MAGGGKCRRVVMVRRGDSQWNKDSRFCGWYDAPLSERGFQEAKRGGQALKQAGFSFDVAFTSLLTRPQQTLEEILRELGQPDLPVQRSWRLNERHYGNLTGLNRAETAAKHGEEQVQLAGSA